MFVSINVTGISPRPEGTIILSSWEVTGTYYSGKVETLGTIGHVAIHGLHKPYSAVSGGPYRTPQDLGNFTDRDSALLAILNVALAPDPNAVAVLATDHA